VVSGGDSENEGNINEVETSTPRGDSKGKGKATNLLSSSATERSYARKPFAESRCQPQYFYSAVTD
jgi:hypothetical protein